MRITVTRTAAALACLVAALAAGAAPIAGAPVVARNHAGVDGPPSVYVDAGACPFECCTYRRWTVRHPVRLLDRPHGRRVVARLRKGEVVDGVTGEVISRPLAVTAERDIPSTPIRAGDTFYVLHYVGEGEWKVWFRGRTTEVDESVVKLPHPRAEWWVKVRKENGVVGWALSDGRFRHQDACE